MSGKYPTDANYQYVIIKVIDEQGPCKRVIEGLPEDVSKVWNDFLHSPQAYLEARYLSPILRICYAKYITPRGTKIY